jgi:hypothetical protein
MAARKLAPNGRNQRRARTVSNVALRSRAVPLWIDRLGVIPSENQRLLAFLFAFRLFFVGPCAARFATRFGVFSLVAAGRAWRG